MRSPGRLNSKLTDILALAGGITPAGDDVVTVTVARERQILQLVAEGKTTKAIGELLGITFKTAESHRNRIMKKLGIHQTAGLVRYAIRHGLVRP